MNEACAFEIITRQITDDTWIVGGVVFKTIKLFDTLTIIAEGDNKAIAFFVQDIMMYGHHLEEIERGSAGQLYLCGSEGRLLSQAKYLYKLESNPE